MQKYVILCPVGTSGMSAKNKENNTSAEIDSNIAFIRELDRKQEAYSVKIYLFPTIKSINNASLETARIIIDNMDMHIKNNNIKYMNNTKIDFITEKLDFNVNTSKNIDASVQTLYDIFDKIIEIESSEDTEIIVNCTSGYKPISIFASVYAMLHELTSIYKFEDQNEVTQLLPLPLSYALNSLDEEITLLKCLRSNKNLLKNENMLMLPKWLQGLLSGENNSIVNALINTYDDMRSTQKIGEGMLSFLQKIDAGNHEAYYNYMLARIDRDWAELWIGDQIPETVEHSRRHSKRLLEIASNILRSADKDVLHKTGLDKPQVVALLISAMLLHDIGHTIIAYPCDLNKEDEGIFPIGNFPSCVREVHHLLSGEMLRCRKDKYFPPSENQIVDVEMFQTLVPLICEHHRQCMRLRKNETSCEVDVLINDVVKLLKNGSGLNEEYHSLEERIAEMVAPNLLDKWGLSVEDILRAAAMLRFIDSCDVQKDRTYGKTFMKARQERTKNEAQSIYKILKALENEDNLVPSQINDLHYKLENIEKSYDDYGRLNEAVSKEIKKNCKEIYVIVLEELLRLGKENDSCNLSARNSQKYEFLSAVNRFAFKCEQFRHFFKHNCVDFVLPLQARDENNKVCINICIWPNQEIDGIEQEVDGIREDVKDELEETSGLLDDLNIRIKTMPKVQSDK